MRFHAEFEHGGLTVKKRGVVGWGETTPFGLIGRRERKRSPAHRETRLTSSCVSQMQDSRRSSAAISETSDMDESLVLVALVRR